MPFPVIEVPGCFGFPSALPCLGVSVFGWFPGWVCVCGGGVVQPPGPLGEAGLLAGVV